MAINSKSKLRDIIADPRASAILEEYMPGFADNPQLGPTMGMRLNILIKFPQAGIPEDVQKAIVEKLDALDA